MAQGDDRDIAPDAGRDCSAEPAVDALGATRDPEDDDDLLRVVDQVDGTEVSEPKSLIRRADEGRRIARSRIARSRIDRESQDRCPQARGLTRGQPSQLALGGGRELDPIAGRPAHEAESSAAGSEAVVP